MTDSTACLVFTTCPDRDAATRLSKVLVERRLAACVTTGPQVHSCYRWQGALQSAEEVPVTIKTHTGLLAALEKALLELHPYEVPEILAVPTIWGHAPYLQWMKENLDD